MFEAIVTLCLTLTLTGPECREVLLPGFEAPQSMTCEDALRRNPPDVSALFPALSVHVPPRCAASQSALDFQQIGRGVYVHRGEVAEPDTTNGGDVANIGIVIGQTSVAVIDSGTARWIGEDTWRAIRKLTDLPVSHVILTHMHPDHVLGATALTRTGAQIVGHAGLARALLDRQENYLQGITPLIGAARMIGTQAPRPDIAVTDKQVINLGGRELHLKAWPVAHTGTDLTVWDAATGVFFAGDLIFDGHTPVLDGSLRGWQAVMTELAALPVTMLVPGHGGPVLDWPAGAAPMRRYLDVLARDTRAAIERGDRLGEAVQIIAEAERPHWQLFDAYNPRNATVAFTELEWE